MNDAGAQQNQSRTWSQRMQIHVAVALSIVSALLGGLCLHASLARDMRDVFGLAGAALIALSLIGAYQAITRRSLEFTVDWRSVRWVWTGRRAPATSVPLSDIDEALFWFDSVWQLWIVLKSGERLHVPCFFNQDDRASIEDEFEKRGVRVREATTASGRRPN